MNGIPYSDGEAFEDISSMNCRDNFSGQACENRNASETNVTNDCYSNGLNSTMAIEGGVERSLGDPVLGRFYQYNISTVPTTKEPSGFNKAFLGSPVPGGEDQHLASFCFGGVSNPRDHIGRKVSLSRMVPVDGGEQKEKNDHEVIPELKRRYHYFAQQKKLLQSSLSPVVDSLGKEVSFYTSTHAGGASLAFLAKQGGETWEQQYHESWMINQRVYAANENNKGRVIQYLNSQLEQLSDDHLEELEYAFSMAKLVGYDMLLLQEDLLELFSREIADFIEHIEGVGRVSADLVARELFSGNFLESLPRGGSHDMADDLPEVLMKEMKKVHHLLKMKQSILLFEDRSKSARAGLLKESSNFAKGLRQYIRGYLVRNDLEDIDLSSETLRRGTPYFLNRHHIVMEARFLEGLSRVSATLLEIMQARTWRNALIKEGLQGQKEGGYPQSEGGILEFRLGNPKGLETLISHEEALSLGEAEHHKGGFEERAKGIHLTFYKGMEIEHMLLAALFLGKSQDPPVALVKLKEFLEATRKGIGREKLNSPKKESSPKRILSLQTEEPWKENDLEGALFFQKALVAQHQLLTIRFADERVFKEGAIQIEPEESQQWRVLADKYYQMGILLRARGGGSDSIKSGLFEDAYEVCRYGLEAYEKSLMAQRRGEHYLFAQQQGLADYYDRFEKALKFLRKSSSLEMQELARQPVEAYRKGVVFFRRSFEAEEGADPLMEEEVSPQASQIREENLLIAQYYYLLGNLLEREVAKITTLKEAPFYDKKSEALLGDEEQLTTWQQSLIAQEMKQAKGLFEGAIRIARNGIVPEDSLQKEEGVLWANVVRHQSRIAALLEAVKGSGCLWNALCAEKEMDLERVDIHLLEGRCNAILEEYSGLVIELRKEVGVSVFSQLRAVFLQFEVALRSLLEKSESAEAIQPFPSTKLEQFFKQTITLLQQKKVNQTKSEANKEGLEESSEF